MKYAVNPNRDGVDSSDITIHDNMVDAVKDMIEIGKTESDSFGPVTSHIETVE